jgi:hypothetical protein
MKQTKRQARRAELDKLRGSTPKVIPERINTGLEDPEARTRETLAAGLIKGETACNRSACQAPLLVGQRWWNTGTSAYYCTYCAMRINETLPGLCYRQ